MGNILEIPDELLAANHEAAESTRLVTQAELDALMEKRAQERDRKWSKLERTVRLVIMELKGVV